MKNKTILAGISALTLSAIVLPSVYAFGGLAGQGGKNFDSYQRAAVETAIENEDFAAFQTATGNTNITQEQFDEMVARHAEMETRRATAEADQVAIQAAITNGDYTTWVNLITAKNPDAPILAKITAANFSKLKDLQNLRTQAQAIEKELGIAGPGLGMGGGMGGMGEGHEKGGRGGMFGGHANEVDEE